MKKNLSGVVFSLIMSVLIVSCGSHKCLIVPRAVSTSESVPAGALNLHKGDYEILKTITETASVTVKYGNNEIKVISGDNEFQYNFKFNPKTGWVLKSFSGTANFGYLTSDIQNYVELPEGEEFARRVAIARLINDIKDFGADGALEPIVTTRASNVGRNTVEYQATVTAKIVRINTTTK